MRLGITGATGFIGRRAAEMARERGREIVPFSRHPRDANTRKFVPGEPADVDGLDAVLHLAGESVLGLWTTKKCARIMDSRVLGTRSVVEGFARAKKPPRTLISGSAIGYYGDTGDHEVDESSPPGRGFLADVCRAWEAEALMVRDARVVLLRTGFVLGREGGAMKSVLPVFRAGLGGRLGNGKQWMSCVHVDDVVGMAFWAMEKDSVNGPLNAVMPHAVSNAEFTRDVARAVHRPAVFPVPAFFLRIALGRMATMLLQSSRVRPHVAEQHGYIFIFPDLTAACAAIAR